MKNKGTKHQVTPIATLYLQVNEINYDHHSHSQERK